MVPEIPPPAAPCQASLVAKDHILHFRCYVQLGRAKDAQELFHQLSPEAKTLGVGDGDVYHGDHLLMSG